MKKITSSSARYVVLAIVGAVASVLRGADVEYSYKSGDTALGDGAVAITYDSASKISALTVTPTDGSTVSITGDALAFAADATITLAASGTLSVASAVMTDGALSVVRGDNMYLSWSGNPLGSVYTQVFTAEQLARTTRGDWEIVSANFGNDSTHGSTVVGLAVPSKQENPCSLNYWDGRHTWGVRFWLSDSSSPGGLKARGTHLSKSFEFINLLGDSVYYHTETYLRDPSVNSTEPARAENINVEGSDVKVDQLTIRRKMAGEATVRFDGGASLNGALTVGLGLKAVLVVSGTENQSLAYPIGGEGTFRIEAMRPASASVPAAGMVAHDGYLQRGWTLVAENRCLGALTNIVGYMHGRAHHPGYSYNNDSNPLLTAMHFKNDGRYATCQFQFRASGEGVIKCYLARFCQHGDDIYGMGMYSGSLSESEGYNLGDDIEFIWDFHSYDIAIGTDSYTYGMEHLTFMFAETNDVNVNVSIDAASAMSGAGKLEFAGSDDCRLTVSANHDSCFHRGGIVQVEDGAELVLNCNLSGNIWTTVSSGTWRPVMAGGSIRRAFNAGNGGFGGNQLVAVDRGSLCFAGGGSFRNAKADCYRYYRVQGYFNLLDLSGGARLTGGAPHTVGGTGCIGRWRVTGDTPCRFDAGVIPSFHPDSHSEEHDYMIFDIEDVTEDDAVDATLGCVYDAGNIFGGGYECAPIEKTGAGTLRLDGDYAPVTRWMRVVGGTLLLSAKCGVSAVNPFRLDGGTLAADTNAQKEVGTLTVGAGGGTLQLASGSSLAFADSSSATWSGSLDIETDDSSSQIRFGENASALTSEQLNAIRLNGRRVKLSSTGWVREDIGLCIHIF